MGSLTAKVAFPATHNSTLPATGALGSWLTVTVTLAVLEHSFPSVPVTVYIVVFSGVTCLLLPSPRLLSQVYEVAPVAVSVALKPAHIGLTGLILTGGQLLTVTVTVAVLEQPLAPVPVTVYVVVPVGVTVYGLSVDVVVPSLHEYDAAPVAVRFASCPKQTALWLVSAETVGSCLTLTVTLAVLEHPLPSVPVTVYVVVFSGVTVLLLPVPRLLSQE